MREPKNTHIGPDHPQDGRQWDCQCARCGGDMFRGICVSTPEWCEAHPIIGREGTNRGEIEWFCTEGLPIAKGEKV